METIELDTFGIQFLKAATREIIRSGKIGLCVRPDSERWQLYGMYAALGGDPDDIEFPEYGESEPCDCGEFKCDECRVRDEGEPTGFGDER